MTTRRLTRQATPRYLPVVQASSGAGFILAELAVTAAVVVILVGLAVGGENLATNRRLASAVRAIASDIRITEQRARAERTCLRILIDLTGEAYTILRYAGPVRPAVNADTTPCPDGASWSSEPVFREDPTDRVTRRMPRGIDLAAATFAANTIYVSPLGNTSAGTLTVKSRGGEERRIVLEITGRVEVRP